MILPDDMVLQQPNDVLNDYIRTPYPAFQQANPTLHPVSLFRCALRHEGWLDSFWPLCVQLQEHLGRNQTVWGFKYGPNGFSVELYFYNFTQNAAGERFNIEAVNQALHPCIHLPVPGDRLAYFMCSIEFIGPSEPQLWRVYELQETEGMTGGISYALDDSGVLELENFYRFFGAHRGKDKRALRAYLQTTFRLKDILTEHPHLEQGIDHSYTTCHATKRNADALYFSRISTDILQSQLPTSFPDYMMAILSKEKRFVHTRWDVGLDFDVHIQSAKRQRSCRKAGIYGCL